MRCEANERGLHLPEVFELLMNLFSNGVLFVQACIAAALSRENAFVD